jgi:S-adenosylmethionine decarboxylase
MKGKHFILDMYECNTSKINDPIFIDSVLTEAAAIARSTLLDLKLHIFEPQGITGFALLAESHISFHSWPESGYVAVDIYTCGASTDPAGAANFIIEKLEAEKYLIKNVSRYTPEDLVNLSESITS